MKLHTTYLEGAVLPTVVVAALVMLTATLGLLALWEQETLLFTRTQRLRQARADVESAALLYRLHPDERALTAAGGYLLYDSLPPSRIFVRREPWGLYELLHITTADSLVALDKQYAQALRTDETSWTLLFERGVTQLLIKQYTTSVNTYSKAIDLNPSNPFLYLNRSTTRAEMIDFISSIDNSYQQITIDSNPANRLNNNSKRTYSYDEAIADLNKAVKLYPDFAYAYYNRANLRALSGSLPEAFEDYSKAIELNPSFAEAYYNRGIIQIFMKDTRKGCLDISKAGELGITEAYEVLKRYAQIEN